MTKPAPLPIEDVLDLFVLETETPSRDLLLAFISRFPHYRRELIDFAALWAEQELLPPEIVHDEAAEAQLATRMQSFVQNQLYNLKTLSQVEATPSSARMTASLHSLAQSSGRSLHDVARASGLDLVLMRKLNARQIRPETIPRRLSEQIAAFIGTSVEQVMVVWTGPPRTGQAAFRAETKPTVAAQEDFADAVAASSLSPDERAALLAAD